eukprot:TRINITY_DN6803_c0_g2_i2.p1 TRINITY_DN6803_c0_g2~~TRINITY_DN6803_c0_g2_i2.p1  ORF type:complete len:144 (-),score=7.34 TRINITY_DN6803_c0_g2_i2:663-1031(-)
MLQLPNYRDMSLKFFWSYDAVTREVLRRCLRDGHLKVPSVPEKRAKPAKAAKTAKAARGACRGVRCKQGKQGINNAGALVTSPQGEKTSPSVRSAEVRKGSRRKRWAPGLAAVQETSLSEET